MLELQSQKELAIEQMRLNAAAAHGTSSTLFNPLPMSMSMPSTPSMSSRSASAAPLGFDGLGDFDGFDVFGGVGLSSSSHNGHMD